MCRRHHSSAWALIHVTFNGRAVKINILRNYDHKRCLCMCVCALYPWHLPLGGPAPPPLHCHGSEVSHGGSYSLMWVTEGEYVWRAEHQVLFATPFSRAVDTGEHDERDSDVRAGGISFRPPHSPPNSFSCCSWQGFWLETTISGLMR